MTPWTQMKDGMKKVLMKQNQNWDAKCIKAYLSAKQQANLNLVAQIGNHQEHQRLEQIIQRWEPLMKYVIQQERQLFESWTFNAIDHENNIVNQDESWNQEELIEGCNSRCIVEDSYQSQQVQ